MIVLFVETPRKFITAKLSIRKPRSSSVLIISTLFPQTKLSQVKTIFAPNAPNLLFYSV